MARSSPYQEASDLVNKVLASRTNRSLKSFFYDDKGSLTCTPKTYALVSKVIQHRKLLVEVVSTVSDKIQAKNVGLLLILLFELFLGSNKSIQGGGLLKRSILDNEEALRDAFERARKVLEKDSTSYDSRQSRYCLPRYVRLNSYNRTNQNLKVIIQRLQTLGSPIYIDPHVPDLLVMPHCATPALLKHEQQEQLENLQRGHGIVLQDKSSCFPALCLVYGYTALDNASLGEFDAGDYLDACAAPGNKTSHLAALLCSKMSRQKTHGNKIEIFALDRDSVRFKLLRKRMQQLVPYNDETSHGIKVITIQRDFLATKPTDYPRVRFILLDPSCSGSGVVTSSEPHHLSNDTKDHREKLVGFQITALRHAMSFPNVQRIVYSTCSIHLAENEQVIAAALGHSLNTTDALTLVNENRTGTLRDQWEVIPPLCLTKWKRRGFELAMSESVHQGKLVSMYVTKYEAECMIRVDPEDETNGFFVCCLQRRNDPGSHGTSSLSTKKKTFSHTLTNSTALCRFEKFGLEEYPTNTFHSSIPLVPKENKTDAEIVQSKMSMQTSTDLPTKAAATHAGNSKEKPEASQSKLPTSRKRQRKLDWKVRQHELKLKRLKTKKGVDANL